MKMNLLKSLFSLASALVLTISLTSCSGTSQEETLLSEKSTELNVQFLQLAKSSSDFLESMSCEYSAPNLLINVELDNDINPEEYSQALVEYVVANYIRYNAGAMMDAIINGINKTKGSLSITIANDNKEAKEFTIGHARLVQLVQKKNSELNFNEVKNNVLALLEKDCEDYIEPAHALGCTFALSNGFAQYTLTFKNAQAFVNQSPGTIMGRFLPIIQKDFEEYGACAPMVQEILKSLQIDGYRVVYTDEAENKKISCAIPWKRI